MKSVFTEETRACSGRITLNENAARVVFVLSCSRSGDHVRFSLSPPRGRGDPSCTIPIPSQHQPPKMGVCHYKPQRRSCFPSPACSIPKAQGFGAVPGPASWTPSPLIRHFKPNSSQFPAAPCQLCIAQGLFWGYARYIPSFSSSSRSSQHRLMCCCLRRTGSGCHKAGV